MTFLTDTLAKAAFKKINGKAHTGNTKDLANEAEASSIALAGKNIYVDIIPTTPSEAILANVSSSLVSLTLVLDASSNGKAYFATISTVAGSPLQGKINPRTGSNFVDGDRVGNLIAPQYGDSFRAILKNSGTEVAPSAATDWFLDYAAGIITSEDNLNLTSGTLEAYVYIGNYLDVIMARHEASFSAFDGYGVFVKGPGGTDGYNIVSEVGIGTTNPMSQFNIYNANDNSLQTAFTQDIANAGLLISSDFVNGNFIPGIFWSTQNNNSTKPKAGIYSNLTTAGSLLYFGTSNSYTTGITNSAMVIDYNGRVGIGTTAPIYNLHVGTGSQIAANLAQIRAVVSNTTATQRAAFITMANDISSIKVEGQFEANGNDQRVIIGSTSNHELQIRTADTVRMTVLGTGLVGIGSTVPTEILTIGSGNIKVDTDNAFIGRSSGNSILWSDSTGFGVLNFKESGVINIDSDSSGTTGAFYINHNQATAAIANNLFTILEDGYIGIGTTIPSESLHIAKNTSGVSSNIYLSNHVDSSVANNVIGRVVFRGYDGSTHSDRAAIEGIYSSTDGSTRLGLFTGATLGSITEKVSIASDGKVGLGTTAPLYDLHVGSSSLTATNTANVRAVVSDNTVGNTTAFIALSNATGPTKVEGHFVSEGSSGRVVLGSSSSHNLALRTGNTTRMTISTTGLVGIGTSTPSHNIHISTSSATADIAVAATAVNSVATLSLFGKETLTNVNAQLYADGDNSKVVMGAVTNHEINFITNNINRMVIDNAGLVGIGTTNPVYDLHIGDGAQGATNLSQVRAVVANAGTGERAAWLAHATTSGSVVVEGQFEASGTDSSVIIGSSTNHAVFLRSANANRITLLSSGNIGIGTTNPSVAVSLGNATGNTKLAIEDTGSSSTAYGFGYQSNQFRMHVGSIAGRFAFLSDPAGTEVVTITGTGKIGIGSTSPGTDCLDIIGNEIGTSAINSHMAQILNTNTSNSTHAILRLGIGESSLNTNDIFISGYSGTTSGSTVGTRVWYIDGEGTLSLGLTMQHWAIFEATDPLNIDNEMIPGFIVSSNGTIWTKNDIETSYPIIVLSNTIGDKKVFGVIASDFVEASKELYLWHEADLIFNILSKPALDDGYCQYSEDSIYFKARVNSGGEGKVLVTNINGEIENGDYITTSPIAGYGQLQDDDILHSYTVAKCTENINWDEITDTIEFDHQLYKKVLIGCTYHCG